MFFLYVVGLWAKEQTYDDDHDEKEIKKFTDTHPNTPSLDTTCLVPQAREVVKEHNSVYIEVVVPSNFESSQKQS